METRSSHSKRGPFRRGILLILSSVLFLIASIYTGGRYRDQPFTLLESRRFERVLHQKERFLTTEFQLLSRLFETDPPASVLNNRSPRYQEIANTTGISIFYYQDEILRYWSDHSVPLPTRWRSRLSRPFLTLRNADYVTVSQPVKGGMLIGLIEVRTHFPFQNEFLVNGFHPDFPLDERIRIQILESNGNVAIQNLNGAYLFSLDFTEAQQEHGSMKALAILSLLLFGILSFAGICQLMRQAPERGRWIWAFSVSVLIAGLNETAESVVMLAAMILFREFEETDLCGVFNPRVEFRF